ncbi:MAG: DNA methyltransferase, partial [Dokdonella sp.]
MTDISKDEAGRFIARWTGVTASELSTAQSFAADLCRMLGVDTPHPDAEQQYMFERPIKFHHGDGSTSDGRIDLYRRGAFVLESKKLRLNANTRGFDGAMLRARSQAEQYARALPASEGRPPFLIVVDVGNRIELYAEFSRSGATYTPFPDPRSHRIALADLADAKIRERLRKVWTDPLTLDPSRESARVTREIAARLATLARSLESAHAPETVAQFLMRCLFTMFAEDVRLLPAESFRDLLLKHADNPDVAMRMLDLLWRDMDSGGFSGVLAADVLRFNGKLFKNPDTLPLDKVQLALLIDAARADWKHVEPAIFGTLLERALSPSERHKLGAHYTPRAYVERLVLPTVIEPLRAERGDKQAAALTLAAEGKADEAVRAIRAFHHRLCTVRVLDPACGSGNFLYVTLEHLKRLEGEVLNALDELGFRQTGLAIDGERADAFGGETVDPHQLLGIELNPRAAEIAEVVLWIGYLQWHFRTRGDIHSPQPVIRDFRNIENRDAVLAYDRIEIVTDERGIPVTRWDGVSMKKSPVTGEDVPNDTKRIELERYVNPRKAVWPRSDFVVGNPPFIGKHKVREALGDGYVEALRSAWPDVPDSADFVMYWWHHAAQLTRRGALRRFGLITTNSIRQTFNRRVLQNALKPEPYKPPIGNAVALNFAQPQGIRPDVVFGQSLSLVFAIPDHPWVDTIDGAAVRISMTVAQLGADGATLQSVVKESEQDNGEIAVSLLAEREATLLLHWQNR